jgi:hypothetical protein
MCSLTSWKVLTLLSLTVTTMGNHFGEVCHEITGALHAMANLGMLLRKAITVTGEHSSIAERLPSKQKMRVQLTLLAPFFLNIEI